MARNYILHIDDLYLTIDHFNETLDGLGNLNFNVRAAIVDFTKSSFTSLLDIKKAMADGALTLSVTKDDETVWSSSDYVLSSANLSVGDNGTSFYANFYIPQTKEVTTENLESVEVITPVE